MAAVAPSGAAAAAVPRSSAVALWALTVLAILAPWPFGSVQPWAVRAITVIALSFALAIGIHQTLSGGIVIARVGLVGVIGLLALGLFQLVPLPPALHRAIATASYTAWHPKVPAAATVLGTVARPVSVYPLATVEWLAFAGGIVLLAGLAAPALSDARRARRACTTMVVGGVAVAVAGVLARALLGPRLYGTIAVPTIAPFGPFVSKNHFAGYVEMAALIGAGLAVGLADRYRSTSSPLGWVRSHRAGRVLAAWAAALACGMGVLVSLSRGGIVSLTAGAAALLVFRWLVRRRHHRERRALVPGFLLALAVAMIVVTLPEQAHERMRTLGTATGDPSGSFRLRTWHDSLRAAAASPWVGQGMGTFADALPRFKTGWGLFRTEHAENEYLEVLVEGGVLGAALLVLAVFQVFRGAVRGMRATDDPLRRGMAMGGLAASMALLVHSAFDFNLRIPSNTVAFGFAAAIAVSVTGARMPLPRSASLALVGATMVSAILLVVSAREPRRLPYADAMKVAAVMAPGDAASLRLRRTEDAVHRYVQHRPLDVEAWLLLAWARMAAGHPDEARELAAYSASLDPVRPDVAAQARRISPR